MKSLKEAFIYILVVCLVMGVSIFIGNLGAKVVGDIEVIQPDTGVKCVVVSKSFNTSVDCWAYND